MSGYVPVCTSRAAASPATGGASSSQIWQLNTVTDVMMNGELRMKSWGSVAGTIATRVLIIANTSSTANESHGHGRCSWYANSNRKMPRSFIDSAPPCAADDNAHVETRDARVRAAGHIARVTTSNHVPVGVERRE